jgi:dihydroxyacetone kinase DhaKLM complex PTS-EIIA-like component DhaM
MANSMPVVISSDQTSLPVSITGEPLKISGTENGTPVGTEFTFVNNVKQQILAAKDRDQAISYADFGTKNQRITQINYTAPSIGVGAGYIAQKIMTYVLDSGKYKRTNITWSII